MGNKKERIASFDFIRAICAVGIVIFHFSCQLNDDLFKPLYTLANGGWGEVFVGAFFILSGAMLYYNYSEIKSLKSFYYKRFKAIYPMFYIAFAASFILRVAMRGFKTKNIFYAGNPLKLFLSVLGVDGYFSYRIDNYYQVGEWFLGAIIMLYALYPLLLYIFKKSALLLTIISVLLYGLVFIPDFWRIPIGFNLLSCLVSFEFGMVLLKYKEKWFDKIGFFVITTALSVIIIFVKIDFIPDNILTHLLSLTLFVSLSFIGKIIMKIKYAYVIFNEISMISFAVFLVHHKVIYRVMDLYMPENNFVSALWLLLIIAVTIALAKVLFVINKFLTNTKLYQKLERKIINK